MPFKACPHVPKQVPVHVRMESCSPSMRGTVKPHDKGHGPEKVKNEAIDGTDHISVGRLCKRGTFILCRGEYALKTWFWRQFGGVCQNFKMHIPYKEFIM